jgi:hypothetical protein
MASRDQEGNRRSGLFQSLLRGLGSVSRTRCGIRTDVTRRASKALRILKEAGDVRSSVDAKGNVMWTLRALAR